MFNFVFLVARNRDEVKLRIPLLCFTCLMFQNVYLAYLLSSQYLSSLILFIAFGSRALFGQDGEQKRT